MHPLLAKDPGGKRLLLGNEAIVRGALEAGVGFFSTYPGTPSSEIGDTFFRLFKDAGVTFEYSINEKVALEVAAGAAASGARTLCAMKHVGLNVAADPLMTLAYIGVQGGMVIVTADDPGCHSSQNEQDNRYYALLSQLPLFDPATPQDCYDMVRRAFELSEKNELPVILRTTTRVSHARGVITLGELPTPVSHGTFHRDPMRFTPVPAVARIRHPVLRKQKKAIAQQLQGNDFDREFGSGSFGILTSGAGSTYAEDLVREHNLTRRVRVLKIAVPHPLDKARVAGFMKKVTRLLVVEELEPFLENQAKAIAFDEKINLEIFGKGSGHFSPIGEFTPDIVAESLFSLMKIKWDKFEIRQAPALPPRPPAMCAGCPHRATFYLAKMAAGKDGTLATDIGCYTLGFAPPMSIGDFFVCMGSSASSSGGIASVTGKRVVGFIGDSTFFHSGMTGLANTLAQNRNVKLVVMDNRTTGMTGHQPHPGAKVPGDPNPALDIESIVRGLGVKDVATIDPKNLGASMVEVRRILDSDGPGVIISRSPCPIYDRKVLRTQRKPVTYRINHDRCKHCGRESECSFCGMEADALVALFRSMRGIETGPGKAFEYHKPRTPKMEHPPCEAACPARICVQGYISRVAAGDFSGAVELIRQRVALPNSLCRICERPCEKVCIRGDYDDPIAINRLKRFAMDQENDADRQAYVDSALSRIVEKGKKVAVIGAGPAGLQCAHDLRMRGYDATVFESGADAGGIARWGIPAHRLPKAYLDKDIEVLKGLGVRFEFNAPFGKNLNTEALKKRGYLAGFMALGQPDGGRLAVPGEDMPGVTDALSFLRQVNDKPKKIGGKVIVVGGGNAAVDAARSALRCKADQVLLLYRRTRKEMPADAEEIQAALDEGVTIETLAAPIAFAAHGKQIKVTCQKMELGKAEKTRRARPIPIEGKTYSRLAAMVIVAVGQNADSAAIRSANLPADKFGRIKIDCATGATKDTFWFAGGDSVTGPRSFVEALEAGKIGAYGIDKALSGKGAPVSIEEPGDAQAMLKENRYHPERVEKTARLEAKNLPPKGRARSFDEVEQTYDTASAAKEAARCLACGTCATCNNCIDNFGCPAFYKEGDAIYINPILCDGCGTCMQICPNGAIEIVQ